MKDMFIVGKFTIKDMVKRKSFVVSTIIILLMIVLGFNIPNIIKLFSDNDLNTKLLIVDKDNIFEGNLNNLKEIDNGYKFIIDNKEYKFNDIKDKIENEEIDEAIVVNNDNNIINIEYIVKDLTFIDRVPEEIINTLTEVYSNIQLSKLNLSKEELNSIKPNFNFELKQTEEKEVKSNPFVVMLISIILFYAIYFCAFQVSSSITTEKTSKIIETLVTSTTPKTIVLGKTIGIGLVGLFQVILIIITALISSKLFLSEGVLDNIIDFSNITLFLGVITLIYFILGYSVYALMYALTGSTVSKPEDVQSANGPISLIAVAGFYLSYFTMMNPTSNLNKLAAILPISSPFCMPFRVMMGVSSIIEIIISLLVLIVTIIIIAKISIKIYSQAILNYGNKISFKELIKLYKNKNF